MSEPDPATAPQANLGQAPAACGFCKRPIVDQYFEFMGRPCCPACAAGVEDLKRRHDFDGTAMLSAGLAGLGAALAGGLVWGLVAKFLKMELGILAVGVGWIVSGAMRSASKGRRGRPMQVLGIALAIVGIVFGKIMALALLASELKPLDQAIPIVIRVLLMKPTALFEAFDLLWMFIAIMGPYRTFKPLNLRIRGPFGGSSGEGQILQFDRVQPAPPPPET
jgi:hypothetical protein